MMNAENLKKPVEETGPGWERDQGETGRLLLFAELCLARIGPAWMGSAVGSRQLVSSWLAVL